MSSSTLLSRKLCVEYATTCVFLKHIGSSGHVSHLVVGKGDCKTALESFLDGECKSADECGGVHNGGCMWCGADVWR